MNPPASSETVRARMAAQRTRDTAPELAVRRAMHSLGLRYRVCRKVRAGEITARPDAVFVSGRVAVFVDGCWWHACPVHGRAAKANAEWWRDKLARNVTRDGRQDAALVAAGWSVLRVRECAVIRGRAREAAEWVRSLLAEGADPVPHVALLDACGLTIIRKAAR